MKKRFLAIVLSLALLISTSIFVACTPKSEDFQEYTSFEMVAGDGDMHIYRDTITDILYVDSGSGITVMVDKDGKPLTYTKYKKEMSKRNYEEGK